MKTIYLGDFSQHLQGLPTPQPCLGGILCIRVRVAAPVIVQGEAGSPGLPSPPLLCPSLGTPRVGWLTSTPLCFCAHEQRKICLPPFTLSQRRQLVTNPLI